MKLSRKEWSNYVGKLSMINQTAGRKMREWIERHGTGDIESLVTVAYALTTKYGEAASATSCAMYDAIAHRQKANVPPAEPKPTQNIKYVDKAVKSTLDRTPAMVPDTVSEMVKRTGEETTLRNAKRDGAFFAWVPNGDSCPFCITLASNGWRRASDKTIKGDHADHIHKNCDCAFAISFDGPGQIAGYDPEKYLKMYNNAEGDNWQDKVNSMRRADYAVNKDKINAQKRAAYARRKALQNIDQNAIMRIDTNGVRNDEPLTEEQIEKCYSFAESLGFPRNRMSYSENYWTGHSPDSDILLIGTDVFPSKTNMTAHGQLDYQCAIAHEVIGHRGVSLHGGSEWEKDDVRDEAQASIRAARFTPGLTRKQREMLIRDAIERLHSKGYRLRDYKDKMDIHHR